MGTSSEPAFIAKLDATPAFNGGASPPVINPKLASGTFFILFAFVLQV